MSVWPPSPCPPIPSALSKSASRRGAPRPRWQADFPLAPAPGGPETRAAYRALAARPPTHRGPFNVYVTASTVTFAKQLCTAADLAPKFILHAAPADPQALPGRPFANLDFYFPARGAQAADACLASVPRPAYPLQRLTVGQWLSGTAHPRWQADRRLWRALATDPPAYRGVFDVHVAADAVAYAKAPCAVADTEPKFLLPVVPVRRRDLPPARRPAGFDNRDFRFAGQGAHFDGRCLARMPLPAYPIASLRVGQFRAGAEPPLGGRDPAGPLARRGGGLRGILQVRCTLRDIPSMSSWMMSMLECSQSQARVKYGNRGCVDRGTESAPAASEGGIRLFFGGTPDRACLASRWEL